VFNNTPTVYVRAWWRQNRSIEVAAVRFRTPPTGQDLETVNRILDACAAERAVATMVRKKLSEHPDLERKLRLYTSWIGPDRREEPTPADLADAAERYKAEVVEEESWKTGV